MTRGPSTADGPAFLRLMKRYVMDYSNSHDQAETRAIMAPDYVLHMGDHVIRGRDDQYFKATRKQMDQFPGLVLTVHEIWTSGRRLVMRFSEHGASARHGGAQAAWAGIGLYDWNGETLVSNFVEQDYFSRARQLKSGAANPVEGPARAPWDGDGVAADPAAEAGAREWLDAGALAATPGVLCDDAWTGADPGRVIDQRDIQVNDLFSCGDRVAFHATQVGAVLPDFDPDASGREGRLHMAGLVRVRDGKVVEGRIVRGRLDLQRAMNARPQ